MQRKQDLFLSENVDDIDMPGREQNLNPMWKKLLKLVDLGERTSFLDSVYLGCTQRVCISNESIIDIISPRFEASGPQNEVGKENRQHASVSSGKGSTLRIECRGP